MLLDTKQYTQQIEQFLQHLSKTKSEHTVKSYTFDLKGFVRYLQSADDNKLVNGQTIWEWLGKLREAGRKATSIQRALSTLRAYGKFIQRKFPEFNNEALDVRGPKLSKPLPKALTTDQVNALLDIELEPGVLGIRDKAIFELLYASGIRLSELVSLDIFDVDLKQQQVAVKGKGGKHRIALFNKSTRVALENWLVERSQLKITSPSALFISRRGGRLTSRQVQYRLNRVCDLCGVPRVSPHVLRHSFASHILQSSGNLRAVQELLGHSWLSSTQVYTKLDFQHLATSYDKSHPRAKKSKQ